MGIAALRLSTAPLTAGIGDAVFSRDVGATLKTYGLGSCVGVCIIDPATNVCAMVHIALPEAKLNPALAASKPFHFADTALPKASKQMLALGASRRRPTWRVKIAGGASTLSQSHKFEIGKRNQLAVNKVLWKLGMAPIAKHVGGSLARTLTMKVGSQEVEVFLGHKERIII